MEKIKELAKNPLATFVAGVVLSVVVLSLFGV